MIPTTNATLPEFASPEQQSRIKHIVSTLRLAHVRTRSALIMLPAANGSGGDEAMVQALTGQLVARGYDVDLLAMNPGEVWKNIKGVRNYVHFDDQALGTLSYVRDLAQYEAFYLIGADVLDGYYDVRFSQWLLWVTYVAAHVTKTTSIVGFSFNDAPQPGVIASFRLLPPQVRLNVRDAVSRARFEKATGRKARGVADVAFLLEPDSTSRPISGHLATIGQWKDSGSRVVGLNASLHSFKSAGTSSVETIAKTLSKDLTELFEKHADLRLVLIAHDDRPGIGDVEILVAIHDRLMKRFKDRILLIDKPVYASGIKAVTKQLNVVISGRMHLAIACLGSGTPVKSVVYQSKFEGLYQHFGLTNMTITPADILKSGRLAKAFEDLLQQEQTLRRRIAKKLPHVLRLSIKNIAARRR